MSEFLLTDEQMKERYGLEAAFLRKVRGLGMPYRMMGKLVRYDPAECLPWLQEYGQANREKARENRRQKRAAQEGA